MGNSVKALSQDNPQMASKDNKLPKNSIPRTLSHYTTIPGLIGIVTSKCLWASNASFLNDRTELLHGLNAAEKAIERLTSTRAMNHWKDTLKQAIEKLEDGEMPDTFVTCFCRDDDNLSQWRGYGGSEQGVSITFDRKKLDARLKNQKAILYQVTYAKYSTASKLREDLKGELAELAEIDDILGEGTAEEKYRDVFKRLSGLLPKFKHLGFRDEREWRYVVQGTDIKLNFRASRNRVVPYIHLGESEEPLPIISVRVGPGDDQALTAQSLRTFLSSQGYKDVKVKLSDVPFRT